MRDKGWEKRGPKAHSKNSDCGTPTPQVLFSTFQTAVWQATGTFVTKSRGDLRLRFWCSQVPAPAPTAPTPVTVVEPIAAAVQDHAENQSNFAHAVHATCMA